MGYFGRKYFSLNFEWPCHLKIGPEIKWSQTFEYKKKFLNGSSFQIFTNLQAGTEMGPLVQTNIGQKILF
jgi:hypothetical protein